MKIVAAGLAFVFLLVAFACGPPLFATCTESCISESVRRVCFSEASDSTLDGKEETCAEGSRCIENFRSNGQTYAACAIGDVDAECKRDKDITYCDGNTLVRCVGRYREETVACGDNVCAEHDSHARCVRSLEPDAHCNPDAGAFDGRVAFCEGDSLFACFGPYAGRNADCAAEGKFCRAINGLGGCRLQAEPDPRCNDLKTRDPYCDGDLVVVCNLGWRDRTHDCRLDGKRCVQTVDPRTNDREVRCE